MSASKKLSQIVQAQVAEARQDSLDEGDVFWLAVGAVNAEARKQGLIGDVLSVEFNAAAQALVKNELKQDV